MIVEFVKGMLGSLSPVLDFMLNNPTITSAILLVWLAIYAAGRVQLWKIEQKTKELVLQISREHIARKPQITSKVLYKNIYPSWSEAVPEWGWFVPHRLDLWPAPVTPENVASKLSFSPQWIANFLCKQSICLAEFEDRKQETSEI